MRIKSGWACKRKEEGGQVKAEGISGGEEVGKQVGVSPAPHPSAGQTAALCLTKCFSSSSFDTGASV